MTLTDIEKKCLMLAMDKSAAEGEIMVATAKFISSLRKRFADGIALIKAMELGDLPHAMQGERVYPTREAAQAAAEAMSRGRSAQSSYWNDIMRDARARGEEKMRQRQQQRQQTWEEYCRRAAEEMRR